MQVFEPKRAIYRKQMKSKKKCEFCSPENIKNQECKSFAAKKWMVLVNKYPYMDGNVMLIPKRHIKDTSELDNEEKEEFFTLLEKVKSRLARIFGTKEFNISLNIGKKAGASIDHMHWQVIPRRDKVLNATNIFADIYVMTITPDQLKKKIESLK